MSVSITAIEDKIRTTLLSSGTNQRVIFYAPNAPRPKLPYTSIQYTMTMPRNFDWTVFDTTDAVNRLVGPREMLFTIICYGDNSVDEATLLNSKFSFSTVLQELNSDSMINIAVQNVLNVNYQNVLHDDNYEKTAFFDIILNVVVENETTTEDTGYFEEIGNPTWSNLEDLTTTN